MRLHDLFEEKRVIFEEKRIIEGDVRISKLVTTLVGYKRNGILIDNAVIKGGFYCSFTNITALKGAPSYVGGHFDCRGTKIISLHDIHKQVKYIGDCFYLSCTIKSHVLGVMFIKGLRYIEFVGTDQNRMANSEQLQVERILNKHLRGDRNIHDCQEELLEAGLVEYAKL